MRYQELLDLQQTQGSVRIDDRLIELVRGFPDVYFRLLLIQQETGLIESILRNRGLFDREELDQILSSGYPEMLQTIIPLYIKNTYGVIYLACGRTVFLLHEICTWPLDEDEDEAYEEICRHISFEPTRDGRIMLDPLCLTIENHDRLIPWQQLQTRDDIKLKQCYSSIFRPSWNYQTHRYYPLDFKAKISNLITLTMNDDNVWNLLPPELLQLIIQEFIGVLSH